MRILLDTNILARCAEPTHPTHILARDAVRQLHQRGDELVIVPQVIYEFWVLATRPLDQNGLGFEPQAAQVELAKIESLFRMLDDSPAVLAIWKQIVIQNQVRGKLAHDARLVAAMEVHGVSEILTFDMADFERFSATIRSRSPREVLVQTP